MSLAHPFISPSRKNAFFILVLSGLFFLLLVILSLLVPAVHAAQVTMAWDRESDSDVAGYKVYYGTRTGQYTSSANAGNATSMVISGLQEGVTYFFAAVAYDITGLESSYSNEVSYMPPVVQSCSYSLSSTSQVFSASGGTGTVSVTTASTCTWSASESSSWIAVTAGSSGTGSGSVTYTVSSNSASSSRSAVLTIAGQTFTVNESGQGSPATNNSHDFNADGKSDLIWQNRSTGQLMYWLMNGVAVQSNGYLNNGQPISDTKWNLVGIGDFNGDGKPDFIWQNLSTGELYYWLMNGTTQSGGGYLTPSQTSDTNWRIACIGDFNGDGKPDIIWQNQATGQLYYWLMNGVTRSSGGYLTPSQASSTSWKIAGCADLDGDGKPDIIWLNQSTGQLYYWLMNGTSQWGGGYLTPSQTSDTNWSIVGVYDINGDGKPDIIWKHQTTGQLYYWLMNGVTQSGGGYLNNGQAIDTNWNIVGR